MALPAERWLASGREEAAVAVVAQAKAARVGPAAIQAAAAAGAAVARRRAQLQAVPAALEGTAARPSGRTADEHVGKPDGNMG
jgi:hypothetical protein